MKTNLGEKAWAGIRRAIALCSTVLREIFDESAYERFLAGSRREASVESYAAFSIERDQARERRARCC